jgi:protein-S-isoprenylcysteine O-methyltransferase
MFDRVGPDGWKGIAAARRPAGCDDRVMLSIVLWIVVFLFPVSEMTLAVLKRADSKSAHGEDHGSMRLLWLAIAAGVALAVASQWVVVARLPFPSGLVRLLALALLLGGLAIRWASIVTLGRLFTVDVAIQQGHALVQRGLYRFVRHPSYSGMLLAFLGLGLTFANWLSLFALMVPVTLAVMNRIAKEERALLAALGPSYEAYCARTKRLFPGLI